MTSSWLVKDSNLTSTWSNRRRVRDVKHRDKLLSLALAWLANNFPVSSKTHSLSLKSDTRRSQFSRHSSERASPSSTWECAWWQDLENLSWCERHQSYTQRTMLPCHFIGCKNDSQWAWKEQRKTYFLVSCLKQTYRSNWERYHTQYWTESSIMLHAKIWCSTVHLVQVKLFSLRSWRCRVA